MKLRFGLWDTKIYPSAFKNFIVWVMAFKAINDSLVTGYEKHWKT